jgi:hypothetical protein
MNEPNYVYRQEDDDRMARADTALRKLNIKKREVLNMDKGGSPYPPAFQFPSGDSAGGQPQGQGLTDDSVAKLLSGLAKGQSKLATPAWPKFGDSYRSYYVFKEELEAYVRDYAHGVSERTLALQIKQHCLSKGTADYLEFAMSPGEILATLGGLFARPSKLINRPRKFSMMTGQCC